MGKTTNLKLLAGFLNHQQYLTHHFMSWDTFCLPNISIPRFPRPWNTDRHRDPAPPQEKTDRSPYVGWKLSTPDRSKVSMRKNTTGRWPTWNFHIIDTPQKITIARSRKYISKHRGGFYPPNHPFVHRVFHYFHHPFWGVFPPLFLGWHPHERMSRRSWKDDRSDWLMNPIRLAYETNLIGQKRKMGSQGSLFFWSGLWKKPCITAKNFIPIHFKRPRCKMTHFYL